MCTAICWWIYVQYFTFPGNLASEIPSCWDVWTIYYQFICTIISLNTTFNNQTTKAVISWSESPLLNVEFETWLIKNILWISDYKTTLATDTCYSAEWMRPVCHTTRTVGCLAAFTHVGSTQKLRKVESSVDPEWIHVADLVALSNAYQGKER